ncbi:MAG TPA: c-type cytochrome [Verrucomicrobiae bacterium]|nr:c-type cytochrome [Verrucomicrobiae bacterium]
MKRLTLLVLSLSGIGAATLIVSCATRTFSGPMTESSCVQRGKCLVAILGCNDCHTPMKLGQNGSEPDMTRMLSGHPEEAKLPPPPTLPSGPWRVVCVPLTAWSGPWGISYAPNLTPDENTGLGIWTEQMFVNAIRTGKHFGKSRPILPPMPWQDYANLTDEDLKAIYAYLRTVPPVVNHVPDPVITEHP